MDNNNKSIDVESSAVLQLVNQYQSINSELTIISKDFNKPVIPSWLNINQDIDSLIKLINDYSKTVSKKMNEITIVLNNTINTLKENDELNMIDFFSPSDLEYLLSGTKITDNNEVALTLEERCKRMEEIANELYDKLKTIKETYKQVYGRGIPYDAKKAFLLIKVLNALPISEQADESIFNLKFELKGPFDDNTAYLSKSLINDAYETINNTEVISVLKEYINGTSWEDSGMEKLFGDKLREMNDTIRDIDDGSMTDAEHAELIFMSRIFGNTITDPFDLDDDFKNFINTNSGSYDDIFDNEWSQLDGGVYYHEIKDISKASAYLKKYLSQNDIIQTFDNLYVEAATCEQLEQDIAIISQMAYDYRFNGTAYAYEIDKNNPNYNYEKYLLLDYQDYNTTINGMSTYFHYMNDFKNMTQGEIAMYMMYLDNNESDKANAYLKSLSDRITSRKALNYVENTISNWNQNGGHFDDYLDSGVKGFCNGVNNYIDSIGSLFGDGRRSESDYVNIYMMSLLSSDNEYTSNLSETFKNTLKTNYEVFNAVGHSAIPVALSLIPGGKVLGTSVTAGRATSMVLSTLSSAGSKYQYARQTGADYDTARGYSVLSGLSDVTMMYVLSGLAGVNGSDAALKSFTGWANGCVKSFGSSFMGTYVDAGIKAWALGETYYGDDVFDQAIHNASVSMASTGITNAAVTLGINAPTILKKVQSKLKTIIQLPLYLFGISGAVPSGSGTPLRRVINIKTRDFAFGKKGSQDILEHIMGYLSGRGTSTTTLEGGHMINQETIKSVNGKSFNPQNQSLWMIKQGDVIEYTVTDSEGNVLYNALAKVNSVASNGVANCSINFTDIATGDTLTTAKESTFFPLGISNAQIGEAAQQAYSKVTQRINKGNYISGRDITLTHDYNYIDRGGHEQKITIQMVASSNGKIISVYPVR